jgi:hypothetical protein
MFFVVDRKKKERDKCKQKINKITDEVNRSFFNVDMNYSRFVSGTLHSEDFSTLEGLGEQHGVFVCVGLGLGLVLGLDSLLMMFCT